MVKAFPRVWSVLSITLLIAILTLITGKVLLGQGVPYTHDGENHLARFANYYIAIQERQIPPRFAPQLMNRYGYPVFNYNYPLANMLSLPFSYAGFEYEVTYKIIVFLSVAAGLTGVWLWLGFITNSRRNRLAGLLTYASFPYLIAAIAYRGNIGEIMLVALLPWVLLSIELVKKHSVFKHGGVLILAVMSLTALSLSHNIGAAFSLPLLLVYGWWRFGIDRSFWMRLFFVLAMSLGLSLWFWLPALAEKQFVILDGSPISQQAHLHTLSLRQLLFSPLAFGFSYPGSIDSLSLSMGLAQALVLIVGSIWLVRATLAKQVSKTMLLVAGALVLVILQLNISKPIWQFVPLLSYMQFPWRLNMFLPFVLAVIVAMQFSTWPKFLRQTFLVLALLQLLVFWRVTPVDRFHKLNRDYDAFSQSTSTMNENVPKTFTFNDISQWQPTPLILSGDGEVVVDLWRGSSRQYRISANSLVTVVEPTMVFPGWETFVSDDNGNEFQASYTNDEEIKGRLAYVLEPGTYTVKTIFTQNTWPRRVGNTVSILSVGVLAGFSLILLGLQLGHLRKK